MPLVHLRDPNDRAAAISTARQSRNGTQATVFQITMKYLIFGLPVLLLLQLVINQTFHSSKVSDSEQNFVHYHVWQTIPPSVEPIIEKRMKESLLQLHSEN